MDYLTGFKALKLMMMLKENKINYGTPEYYHLVLFVFSHHFY
jgi:hypothetical protein